MHHGPIWNKLPQYALPVAATGILEQLFNASDPAIVGNFASTDRTVVIAAVGANSPVIGVILNPFIGLSLGSNVVIADAIGRGNKKDVEQAVHTSVAASFLGGILVTLLMELHDLPQKPDLPHPFNGLSGKSVHYCAADLYRTVSLPPGTPL